MTLRTYENAAKLRTLPTIKRKDLVLPELSYLIVGALFEVAHELGPGLKEMHYYPAIKYALEKRGLTVKQQVYVPIQFQDKKIGKCYLDFLINDTIVLEIKVSGRFRKQDYEQIKAYLSAKNCPLGIIARFDTDGVTFNRILKPTRS